MYKQTASSSSSSSSPFPADEITNEQTNKYKGVRKRKWGKWVSEIRLPNSRERIWLGSYDTAEKAARAFDAALFCLRGPTAQFNFPDNPPNIVGGQHLSPSEIQSVAALFANSDHPQEQPQHHHHHRPGDLSLFAPSDSSTYDGSVPMEVYTSAADGNGIDWSFLNRIDSQVSGGGVPIFPDIGMYSGFDNVPGESFISPYHGGWGSDDDDGGDQGDENADQHYDQQFYLWNF